MKTLSVCSLSENTKNNQLYIQDGEDQLLVQSIKQFGVLEPLVVNSDNVILSGVRRYRAAVQLGIQYVPVVHCDLHNDDLTFGRLVSYNMQRIKSNEMVLKEYLALCESMKIRQGVRTDLDPNRVEKESRLAALYRRTSRSSILRLKQIFTTAFTGNGGDVENSWEWVRKTDKKSIDGILQQIKNKYGKVEPTPRYKPKPLKKVKNTPVQFGTSPLSVVHRDSELMSDPYRLYHGTNTLMSLVLEDNSVDCVFTSTPYYCQRDYNIGENQLGQEGSVKEFIKNMMKTFTEVHRVLKPTGSLFLNIDDTVIDGNLCGVPEKLVIEMKKNGWILNDRIIWLKSNPVYQRVKRTQPSTEFIYHFVKTKQFKYDTSWIEGYSFKNKEMTYGSGKTIRLRNVFSFDGQVLKTSVANTKYIQKKLEGSDLKVNHTATFPRELPLIGILSSTKPNDVVLDPFNGLGTTGEVALELGRKYVGIDLNEEYLKVSQERLKRTVEEVKQLNFETSDLLKLVA